MGFSVVTIIAFFMGSLLAPFLIMAMLTPHTLRLYVHVSCIELMKRKDTIRETSLRQKAQSTMTMLAMIDTMASQCRQMEMREEVSEGEAQARLESLSHADVSD